MEYRVYERGESLTYFEAERGGTFFCTHGAWRGTPTEVDGKPALDHNFGTAVYDSFRDLTPEEYDKEFNYDVS